MIQINKLLEDIVFVSFIRNKKIKIVFKVLEKRERSDNKICF